MQRLFVLTHRQDVARLQTRTLRDLLDPNFPFFPSACSSGVMGGEFDRQDAMTRTNASVDFILLPKRIGPLALEEMPKPRREGRLSIFSTAVVQCCIF